MDLGGGTGPGIGTCLRPELGTDFGPCIFKRNSTTTTTFKKMLKKVTVRILLHFPKSEMGAIETIQRQGILQFQV